MTNLIGRQVTVPEVTDLNILKVLAVDLQDLVKDQALLPA